MKKILISITLGIFLLSFIGCDKDFVEINTNPNAITKLDPSFQLTYTQINSVLNNFIGQSAYPANIIQQMAFSIGGVLLGGNQNQLHLQNSGQIFTSLYSGPIKNLIDLIDKTKDNPFYVNIYNMGRIIKAYNFIILVDTYGDVPYSDAGKAFLEGVVLPDYDRQEDIYDDILFELEDATDKLDPSKVISADIFFRGDIAKWKKFGNSLLLRAGMRYTKLDEAKARAIVMKAVDPNRGGVMTSNGDNVFVKFNTTTQTNSWSNGLIGAERNNTYVPKAFVDYLKKTNDPRGKYILVRYGNPVPSLGQNPNTVLANQYGLPMGSSGAMLDALAGTSAEHPPKVQGVYGYSQFNRQIMGLTNNPEYLITCDQTLLLMAEAVVRGYITGTAKAYYEQAVRASLNKFMDYSPTINITAAEVDAYLLQPDVAWDLNDPYEVINEQYWLASFRQFTEAWSNFRRSGYPDEVQPIDFPGEDPTIEGDAGGFIRRLVYPNVERTANKENYETAAARIGGDELGTRIFWDVK